MKKPQSGKQTTKAIHTISVHQVVKLNLKKTLKSTLIVAQLKTTVTIMSVVAAEGIRY